MVPVTTKGKGLNLLDFFGMPKKSIQAKAQEPEPRADAAPAAPIVPAAPVAPRSTSKHEVPLPGRQSIQSKRKHKQQVPSKPKYSVGTRIKKVRIWGPWPVEFCGIMVIMSHLISAWNRLVVMDRVA